MAVSVWVHVSFGIRVFKLYAMWWGTAPSFGGWLSDLSRHLTAVSLVAVPRLWWGTAPSFGGWLSDLSRHLTAVSLVADPRQRPGRVPFP